MGRKHSGKGTRLYRIWLSMRNRCNNPKTPRYADYGGRGIKVCEEWDDFKTFHEWAIAHGYSENLTIDRIDNDKGYYPENCRWADSWVQANNTRHCHMIEYCGETHSLSEWARILHISRPCLNNRILHCGYSIERAFTEPVGMYVGRKKEK